MSDPRGLEDVRSFGYAVRFHLIDQVRVTADAVLNFLTPIFYACTAYFLYIAGDRSVSLADLTIGTGLMGMWSTIIYGSGTVIRNQRTQGTLEWLLGAPKSLASSVAPVT